MSQVHINRIESKCGSRMLRPAGGGIFSGTNIATYLVCDDFYWAEWVGSTLWNQHGPFPMRDAAFADAQIWIDAKWQEILDECEANDRCRTKQEEVKA